MWPKRFEYFAAVALVAPIPVTAFAQADDNISENRLKQLIDDGYDALSAPTEVLDAHFSQVPMAYWQALLAGGVPVAPVYELGDALDNPWLETIGIRQSIDYPNLADTQILASPLKLDGQRLPNRAAPLLGEDVDDLLDELGYDEGEIADMRSAVVV